MRAPEKPLRIEDFVDLRVSSERASRQREATAEECAAQKLSNLRAFFGENP